MLAKVPADAGGAVARLGEPKGVFRAPAGHRSVIVLLAAFAAAGGMWLFSRESRLASRT